MSARRTYVVNVVGPWMATVAGYGSRELLIELGARPVWSSISRAWAVRPSSARDFIAAAEMRGAVVTLTEGDPLPESRGVLF